MFPSQEPTDWNKLNLLNSSLKGGANYSPPAQTYSWDVLDKYHDGGFVGGAPSLGTSEKFAKLMEGEYVINPAQMDNFVNRIMPKVIANTAGEGAGDITIDMPITVQGTLDKTVLPDLEFMVNKIVYSAVRSRGGTRNANAYSI